MQLCWASAPIKSLLRAYQYMAKEGMWLSPVATGRFEWWVMPAWCSACSTWTAWRTSTCWQGTSLCCRAGTTKPHRQVGKSSDGVSSMLHAESLMALRHNHKRGLHGALSVSLPSADCEGLAQALYHLSTACHTLKGRVCTLSDATAILTQLPYRYTMRSCKAALKTPLTCRSYSCAAAAPQQPCRCVRTYSNGQRRSRWLSSWTLQLQGPWPGGMPRSDACNIHLCVFEVPFEVAAVAHVC